MTHKMLKKQGTKKYLKKPLIKTAQFTLGCWVVLSKRYQLSRNHAQPRR
jgi:hypothetical protein